jgi:hypothetical protein
MFFGIGVVNTIPLRAKGFFNLCLMMAQIAEITGMGVHHQHAIHLEMQELISTMVAVVGWPGIMRLGLFLLMT